MNCACCVALRCETVGGKSGGKDSNLDTAVGCRVVYAEESPKRTGVAPKRDWTSGPHLFISTKQCARGSTIPPDTFSIILTFRRSTVCQSGAAGGKKPIVTNRTSFLSHHSSLLPCTSADCSRFTPLYSLMSRCPCVVTPLPPPLHSPV